MALMGMNQGMPGGFVRDGGDNSAMQHTIAVQKFFTQRKVDRYSVAMFSNHPQGKAVLECHAGMIANCPFAHARGYIPCPTTKRSEVAPRVSKGTLLLGYDVVQVPIQRVHSIANSRGISGQR